MSKLKLQVPIGTGDYLPTECAQKRRLETIFRDTFQANGYDEIETPSFEYYDVFMHDAVPYVQENMIKFFDTKGRILALRPDMTGPIARLAVTKLMRKNEALRLCYVESVYGYKRGSQRAEFTQAGVELIGKRSVEADAEVLAVAIQSLLSAGLQSFQIDIGQVAYFKGLVTDAGLADEQVERIRLLIDSKNSVELEYELSRMDLDEQVKVPLLALPGLFGGEEALEKASGLVENTLCLQAVENIREVYAILCDFGYGEHISIDFGLLNDFNYYTGILFRGIADGIGEPILSGGRYDDLLAEFGQSTPATGFAIGIREVLSVLERQGNLTDERKRITVIKCADRDRAKAYQHAQKLRSASGRVLIDTNGTEYPSEQFDVIQYD